jgi:hypothetical protein
MGIRTKILAPYKTKTPLETMEESRGFTGPYWDHRMGGISGINGEYLRDMFIVMGY